MLSGGGFEYAVCGGRAVDMFIGRNTRAHGDIDILAYWSERDKIIAYMLSLGFSVYEMLGGGKVHRITDTAKQMRIKRNIFCAKDGCELFKLYPEGGEDVFRLEFFHGNQVKADFIEILFNDRTETDFLYARDKSVSLPLERAFLSRDGLPYLAPELCLLYKSTDTEREGYQADFDLAYPLMSEESRAFLQAALRKLYPDGHKWIV